MTNFQFYLLAQVYNSGTYGGDTYQCNGEQCETQSGLVAPSTGVFRQDNGFDYGIMAIILVASLIIAGVVLYVKKRVAKNN